MEVYYGDFPEGEEERGKQKSGRWKEEGGESLEIYVGKIQEDAHY